MPRARLAPVSIGFGALAIVALCSASRAQQPDAPRVLRFAPAHDASEVDPALTELQVVFDRDMDQKRGWTFCGGGPSFPAASAIAWRDARTLVLTVALKPGQRYETTLNCANSAQRFRDGSGKPLAATSWVFTTSGTAPKAPPVNAETNARAFAALQDAIETRYSHRDRLVDDWKERFATHREALLDRSLRWWHRQQRLPTPENGREERDGHEFGRGLVGRMEHRAGGVEARAVGAAEAPQGAVESLHQRVVGGEVLHVAQGRLLGRGEAGQQQGERSEREGFHGWSPVGVGHSASV